MVNKVELDNSKNRLMTALTTMEETIAQETEATQHRLRAQQKVLSKFPEVISSDSHWKALELADDFVRD